MHQLAGLLLRRQEYNDTTVVQQTVSPWYPVADTVALDWMEVGKEILGKELAEMVETVNKAAGNTADVVTDVLNSEHKMFEQSFSQGFFAFWSN